MGSGMVPPRAGCSPIGDRMPPAWAGYKFVRAACVGGVQMQGRLTMRGKYRVADGKLKRGWRSGEAGVLKRVSDRGDEWRGLALFVCWSLHRLRLELYIVDVRMRRGCRDDDCLRDGLMAALPSCTWTSQLVTVTCSSVSSTTGEVWACSSVSSTTGDETVGVFKVGRCA